MMSKYANFALVCLLAAFPSILAEECAERVDSPLTLASGQTCDYASNPIVAVAKTTTDVTITIKQTWIVHDALDFLAVAFTMEDSAYCSKYTNVASLEQRQYVATCASDGYAEFNIYVHDNSYSSTLDAADVSPDCAPSTSEDGNAVGGLDPTVDVSNGKNCLYTTRIACLCNAEPAPVAVAAPSTQAPIISLPPTMFPVVQPVPQPTTTHGTPPPAATPTPIAGPQCTEPVDGPLTMLAGATCAFGENPIRVVAKTNTEVIVSVKQTWRLAAPLGMLVSQYREGEGWACVHFDNVEPMNEQEHIGTCGSDGYAEFDFYVHDATYSETLDNAEIPQDCLAHFGEEGQLLWGSHYYHDHEAGDSSKACHYSIRIGCSCERRRLRSKSFKRTRKVSRMGKYTARILDEQP